MAKKQRRHSGIFPHIIALLLTFLGTLFLILVLTVNVPIPESDSPLATDVRYRLWLVQISDTGRTAKSVKAPKLPGVIITRDSGTDSGDGGVGGGRSDGGSGGDSEGGVTAGGKQPSNHKRQETNRIPIPISSTTTYAPLRTAGLQPGDDDEDRTGSPSVPRPVTDPSVPTNPSPSDPSGQRPKPINGDLTYALGAYGWCEWVRGDDYGYAYCRTKALWTLPKDAYDGDGVVGLGLPAALTVSLSVASFFIVLGAAQGALTLALLTTAMISPPTSGAAAGYGLQSHSIATSKTGGCIAILLILAWCLPSLITVGVGVSQVNEVRGRLVADHGLGVGFLAAGMSLLIVSTVIQMSAGLRTIRGSAKA